MFEQHTMPLPPQHPQSPRLRRSWRRIVWLPIVAVLAVVAALAATLGLGRESAVAITAPGTGTVVFDRVTNQVLRADNPDQRFRSASLVKLFIGIDLIKRGVVTPQRPSPRMSRMLAVSDDKIASDLWVSEGGPEIVTRVANLVGLTNTEPPASRGRWGDTLISANDMIKTYQYILALPTAERTLLLDPLRNAPRTAGDGENQHFGIPSGLPGAPWAIKQGWAAGRGGVDAHTSGLVGNKDRYIVVVLTHYPEGFSLPMAEQLVTAKVAELAPLVTEPAGLPVFPVR